MFEMIFFKWSISCHFPYESDFFVKILIYRKFTIMALKKTHLWYDNYQTFHMVHKPRSIIWNHNV